MHFMAKKWKKGVQKSKPILHMLLNLGEVDQNIFSIAEYVILKITYCQY